MGAFVAFLGLYFRRPLAACAVRVKRLPELLTEIRGRMDAPDEELQEFNTARGGGASSPSARGGVAEPASSEVVRAGTRGVSAVGSASASVRRGGGVAAVAGSDTSTAAAAIQWEWNDDDDDGFSPKGPSSPAESSPFAPPTASPATHASRAVASAAMPSAPSTPAATPSRASVAPTPAQQTSSVSEVTADVGDGWGHDEADGDGWGDSWGDDDGWDADEPKSPARADRRELSGGSS